MDDPAGHRFPLLWRAEQLLAIGRSADAAAAMREAIAADPQNPRAFLLLGRAQIASGDAKAALETLSEARRHAPNDVEILYYTAHAQFGLKRFQQAAETLHTGAEIDPQYPALWSLLSLVHVNMGPPEAAWDAARRGLRLDPEDLQCMRAGVYSLMKLSRPADARRLCEGMLQKHPAAPESHELMGWLRLWQHEGDQAGDNFRESLRQDAMGEGAHVGIRQTRWLSRPGIRQLIAYRRHVARQPPHRQALHSLLLAAASALAAIPLYVSGAETVAFAVFLILSTALMIWVMPQPG